MALTAAEMAQTTLTPEQVQQLEENAPEHLEVLKRKWARKTQAEPTPEPPAAEAEEFILDFDEIRRTLSVKEAAELEKLAGVPYLMFGQSIRGIAALVYSQRRKTDPKYTYEQALAQPAADLLSLLSRSAEAATGPLGVSESESDSESSQSA
jgi:hypothetical protein